VTSREVRNQRREAERKARKLEYQQNRNAASAGAISAENSFAPNPEIFDEFSAEEQAEMSALRARVHARAGVSEPLSSTKAGPTGPRSPEGKTISSGNSLKHGLASGRVIIPGEDPADFEALLADLVSEHSPATETEALLVQQMAQSWWLTQRAIRLQNQAFTETQLDSQKLALFLRYQTTHERAFYKALNSLIKLQKEHGKFVSQKPQQQNGFVSQNHASAVPVCPPVGPTSVGAGLQPSKLTSLKADG
jgi:hypothetical protein